MTLNAPPLRQYLMTRNTLILAREYMRTETRMDLGGFVAPNKIQFWYCACLKRNAYRRSSRSF